MGSVNDTVVMLCSAIETRPVSGAILINLIQKTLNDRQEQVFPFILILFPDAIKSKGNLFSTFFFIAGGRVLQLSISLSKIYAEKYYSQQ